MVGGIARLRLHVGDHAEAEAAGEVGPHVVVVHGLGAVVREHHAQPAAQQGLLVLAFQVGLQLAVLEEQGQLGDVVELVLPRPAARRRAARPCLRQNSS